MSIKNIPLLLAGGFSALPFSILVFPPLLIIGFYIFLKRLLVCQSLKESFLIGFIFSFGYFLVGLHWIIFPLTFDDKFKFLIPFAIIIFPAFFSLFNCTASIFCTLYFKIFNKKNYFYSSSLVLSIIFFGVELLRSKIFGGFPWNLYGHIWSFNNNFIIITKYVGVYGLSFLTILWVMIVSRKLIEKNLVKSIIFFLLLPLLLFFIGVFSQKNYENQKSDSVKIRIIQPNIPQEIKWSAKHKKQNLDKLISLSIKDLKEPESKRIIIWPEVAITFFLNDNKELINYLYKKIPINTILIVGSLRKYEKKIYNSLYVITHEGIKDFYDKIRLVPFGEFVPLRNYFNINKITDGDKDFNKGERRKVIKIDLGEHEIIFEPSICYEGIFPEREIKNNRPDILINLTNDAWFGSTTGPYQHLVASMFRSVERGLYLFRSANSGISAIFDNKGKLINFIPLNIEGFVEEEIRLTMSKTIYSEFGNRTIIFLIFIIFLVFFTTDKIFMKKKRLI